MNLTAVEKFWQVALKSLGATETNMGVNPKSAAWLVEVITAKRPSRLLELGAGFSTLVIADACAEVGATMMSYDHDQDWLGRVWRKVREAQDVGLVRAPSKFEIYNRLGLESMMGKAQAGLQFILVDHGPSMDQRLLDMQGLARMLDVGGIIVLDDCRKTTKYERQAGKLLAQVGMQLRTTEKAKAHANRWLSYAERR